LFIHFTPSILHIDSEALRNGEVNKQINKVPAEASKIFFSQEKLHLFVIFSDLTPFPSSFYHMCRVFSDFDR